ncbi:hypothetical protein [Roseobacter sp. MH60115]|uniref:hypothetical protein n=1 Tax=Roseobacter sp. MH60115 TaxID=2785324 RepID=UPI0018A2D4FE|nr:hypothetical protein [Roseobacter sp. MH60115]
MKAAALALYGLLPTAGSASDFTAGKVISDMNAAEQYSYLAGLTEGLAYARYRADGSMTNGMTCIYQWFYDEDGTFDVILAAFAKFQERTPGAIMAALIQRRCDA